MHRYQFWVREESRSKHHSCMLLLNLYRQTAPCSFQQRRCDSIMQERSYYCGSVRSPILICTNITTQPSLSPKLFHMSDSGLFKTLQSRMTHEDCSERLVNISLTVSDIRVRVKDKDYEWNMIMNDSNDDNTCKKIKSKNKNDESENGTYEYSSSISTSTTTMIPTLKMFWRGNKTTSKLKSAYKLISQRWKCECLHHTIKLLKGETSGTK